MLTDAGDGGRANNPGGSNKPVHGSVSGSGRLQHIGEGEWLGTAAFGRGERFRLGQLAYRAATGQTSHAGVWSSTSLQSGVVRRQPTQVECAQSVKEGSGGHQQLRHHHLVVSHLQSKCGRPARAQWRCSKRCGGDAAGDAAAMQPAVQRPCCKPCSGAGQRRPRCDAAVKAGRRCWMACLSLPLQLPQHIWRELSTFAARSGLRTPFRQPLNKMYLEVFSL